MGSDLPARLEATPDLLSLVAEVAERRGSHPAIEFLRTPDDTSPRAITYAQLVADARRAAAGLRALGAGEGDGVAILLPIVPEAMIALVAATSMAVGFPMNLMMTAEAIAAQLELARAKVAITLAPHPQLDARAKVDAALAAIARSGATPPRVVEIAIGAPHSAGAFTWDDLLALGDRSPAVASGEPDAPGALLHTGGTTGSPKLAQLSRKNLVAGSLMIAASVGWRESDRVVSGLPLFHVGGLVDAFGAAASAGGTLIVPTALGVRSPAVIDAIWQILARTHATALAAVPTSLAGVAAVPRDPALALPHLRGVATGGSPIASDLVARIEKLSGVPVAQIYGMTELAGVTSTQKLGERNAEPSVGMPAPLAKVSIGAPGDPYEPGRSGEVFVGGPQLFQGYRTREGLVRDRTDGWIGSGDLGEVLPDGNLVIRGRRKDVIIRGGHNIDPVMIEDVAAAHPAVVIAAAVAMPDEYAGELPVLFISTRGAYDETSLRTHLEAHIADRAAHPKQIFVVEQMPLTGFGKVARFKLRQAAVERLAAQVCAALPGFRAARCADEVAKRVTLELAPGTDASAARLALERMGLAVELA